MNDSPLKLPSASRDTANEITWFRRGERPDAPASSTQDEGLVDLVTAPTPLDRSRLSLESQGPGPPPDAVVARMVPGERMTDNDFLSEATGRFRAWLVAAVVITIAIVVVSIYFMIPP